MRYNVLYNVGYWIYLGLKLVLICYSDKSIRLPLDYSLPKIVPTNIMGTRILMRILITRSGRRLHCRLESSPSLKPSLKAYQLSQLPEPHTNEPSKTLIKFNHTPIISNNPP